ncbi:MAG: hypothetical protein ACRDO4_05320 [Nocardioides sp.]
MLSRVLVVLCAGLLVGLLPPAAGTAPAPGAAESGPLASVDKFESHDIGDEGFDHELTQWIRRFRLEHPNLSWGRNVATLIVDVTGLTTRPGPVPLRGAAAEVFHVSMLSIETRELLELDDDVVYLAAITRANEGSLRDNPGRHTEPLLTAAAQELLRELGVTGKFKARRNQRGNAVVSERSACRKCQQVLRRDVRAALPIHLVQYVPSSDGSNENANELGSMWGDSEEVERDRAAMEAVRKQKELEQRGAGAFSPGTPAADPCGGGGHAMGPDGPVDLQLVCGHTESASGLTKALAARHGGIDFTSLELSYLSDVPDGSTHEVTYAFAARRGGRDGDPMAGVRGVRESSDAFFVWLALPASQFWVNLNPNEPHRIIEKAFGRTHAGRVLLEADLQLKKSVAHFTDPRNRTGEKFWESLAGAQRCVSMRQWIVPGRAVVHATDEELHIVEAPLRVKMETSYIDDQGTGQYRSCQQESPEAAAHNERVYRTQVLPLVERRVNKGPEYAALRRVYRSRVAAEWVRERHGYQRTAYDDVIGSGRIGRWATEARWKPIDTFRAYVRSYRDHEYELVDHVPVGNTVYTVTYVYGGVDFAAVPMRRLAGAAFDRKFPGLADAAAGASNRPTRVPGSSRMLLGGTTQVGAPQADPNGAGGAGGDEPVTWWQVLLGVLTVTVLLSGGAFFAGLRRAR